MTKHALKTAGERREEIWRLRAELEKAAEALEVNGVLLAAAAARQALASAPKEGK